MQLVLITLTFVAITSAAHSPTVAFWNVFWKQTINYQILQEQYAVMATSGLLDRLERVFISSIGSPSFNLSNYFPSKKIHHLYHATHGEEVLTLKHLFRFCKTHPRSRVLYFHNKGSFTPTPENRQFRLALDCHVLTPACLNLLNSSSSSFTTCGMRLSPIPKPHYPGNFWWSRCDHINSLIDPLSYLNNQTFKLRTKMIDHLPPACIGAERFFAEHWLLSSPIHNPVDCLQVKYLYGYILPNFVTTFCPNFTPHFNQITQNLFPSKTKNISASNISFVPKNKSKNIHLIYPNKCRDLTFLRQADPYHSQILRNMRTKCSSEQSMINRTKVWYGQSPKTFLKWLELMRNTTKIVKV
jgi:hypothetical protein